MNAIFRCGDVVVRVATPTAPAERSVELAHVLIDAGIPVVAPVRQDVVTLDDMSATAWDYVEASGRPIDWKEVGRALRRVHALPLALVPDGLPVPSPTAFPWWDFETLLAEVEGAIDAEALAGLRACVDRWSGWVEFDDVVLCHGDVHPGNVIMGGRGPVLIDWDLLCVAPRGWDHAPMMTWEHPWGGAAGTYEALADGYGWSGRGDDSSEAFAELRLVAATLMRVKAAAIDPEARAEAAQRLEYWRGDPEPPTWRAQ